LYFLLFWPFVTAQNERRTLRSQAFAAFANVRKRSQTFASVRKRSQAFANVRKRSQTFASVRKRSQTFANVRERSQISYKLLNLRFIIKLFNDFNFLVHYFYVFRKSFCVINRNKLISIYF
jgi:hypothetical protein